MNKLLVTGAQGYYNSLVDLYASCGGDMPENNPFVERLMTNAEVIAVDQNAEHPRQIFRENGKAAWCSNIPGSKDIYLAFFNLKDRIDVVSISFNQLGLAYENKIRDLWSQKDIGFFSEEFTDTINPHGAKIYRISSKN